MTRREDPSRQLEDEALLYFWYKHLKTRGRFIGSPLPVAVLFLQKSAPVLPSFGVGAFLYIFVTAMY